MKKLKAAAAIGLVVLSSAAFAHGAAQHGDDAAASEVVIKEQKPWGIAGEASEVVRTVNLEMSDAMRFAPALIKVREGETLRIKSRNIGRVMHEIVIGTKATLDEHAALMKRFPNMVHDEPYMSHVAVGAAGEIVWTFNRVGNFDFACLIPGHYEAGMVGRIEVVAQ